MVFLVNVFFLKENASFYVGLVWSWLLFFILFYVGLSQSWYLAYIFGMLI